MLFKRFKGIIYFKYFLAGQFPLCEWHRYSLYFVMPGI